MSQIQTKSLNDFHFFTRNNKGYFKNYKRKCTFNHVFRTLNPTKIKNREKMNDDFRNVSTCWKI